MLAKETPLLLLSTILFPTPEPYDFLFEGAGDLKPPLQFAFGVWTMLFADNSRESLSARALLGVEGIYNLS
jgi:hypothetical protein